jgi:hypothetical protein
MLDRRRNTQDLGREKIFTDREYIVGLERAAGPGLSPKAKAQTQVDRTIA